MQNVDLNDVNLGNDAYLCSFRRLCAWFAVGLLMARILQVPPVSFGCSSGAAFVLFTFLLFDIDTADSRRYHGVLALSYYSTAVAYAIAASGLIFPFSYRPPEPDPLPEMSMLEEFYFLLSGQLFAQLLHPLFEFILILYYHFLLFCSLTVISFVLAFWFGRRRPEAVRLVLMNVPGMILVVGCLFAVISAAMAK